ncbi:MAG: hypothetical protein DHS20C13_23390 [Thermodesulfobacteriota bacterium]|nr:MAG: hypothetical protein DHS20C13_23390 [Thermodesulfobacteriota bacterium]
MITVFETSLHDIPIVNIFVGEGIYEKNIYYRSDTNRMAAAFLIESPLRSLVGIPHSEWSLFYIDEEIEIGGLHNHFLSNIIFLGLLGGLLNMLLYIIPLASITKNLHINNKGLYLTFLATVGTITCLQFYEGFFSIITIFILSTLWVMSCRLKKEKEYKQNSLFANLNQSSDVTNRRTPRFQS